MFLDRWFKKKVEAPVEQEAAEIGMKAQDILIEAKADWDENMKADHFRAETIAAYLKEKEVAGINMLEAKYRLLKAEMEMLLSKVTYQSLKKELGI